MPAIKQVIFNNRPLDWLFLMPRVIIIGSGIAGLFAALELSSAGYDVLVVTKQRPEDSSTNWAQGGIAAILDQTDISGIESHIADTLACGDGQCDEEAVRVVVSEAGERIKDLLSIGVSFERTNEGFHLAKEGGHSTARILHAKDATGKEIESALNNEVARRENIELRPMTLAVDLIQRKHGSIEEGICGIWCLNLNDDTMTTELADAIMIATGGAGKLWAKTTNPPVATGDGLAMAYRAGANVKDMAFVQFHPTALMITDERPFLVTEALRGAGGVLLDDEGLAIYLKEKGDPAPLSFTLEYSDKGSLATRDIVARACDNVIKRSGADHVWLVCDHLDKDELQSSFPTITERLQRHGITLGKDPLPVAPAAHYMVGGLDVDLQGRVQTVDSNAIPGLYGIGEVACTGMHGANRLASNSLLEGVVFAHRAARHIITELPSSLSQSPDWLADGLHELLEHAPLRHDLESLQATMTDDVGLVRRFSRLKRALRRLNLLSTEVDLVWKSCRPSRDLIELRNLILVATLIAQDSLSRKENHGLHFNADLVK